MWTWLSVWTCARTGGPEEFAFPLVQVNRFHADRKKVRCFSYERGDNFQVKMVEVQLEMSFLRRGNLNCVGFGRGTI